jgi:hypothetical protein
MAGRMQARVSDTRLPSPTRASVAVAAYDGTRARLHARDRRVFERWANGPRRWTQKHVAVAAIGLTGTSPIFAPGSICRRLNI